MAEDFLYKTIPGRMLLKLLIRPKLSEKAGKFLDSSYSRFLIKPFIKSYNISTEGVIVPDGGFKCFNDFFKRERVLEDTPKEGYLCAPCDGWLSIYPITKKGEFTIKKSVYSIETLLEDKALAKRFIGGYANIFRLTPADYHRYTWVDNGRARYSKRINGVLHTVRPVAIESVPVFHRNCREYTLFESDNFGTIVQMEVGAMLVGRIVNKPLRQRIFAGKEKGYFEYGGSTIIVLTEPGKFTPDNQILDRLNEESEIHVTKGDPIGK